GVFLIELAPVLDARLLELTVATACGVREQRKRPILEVLLKTLATSRMLLVLDGCEHLVEPCAALVGRIQRSCPKVTVLITSLARVLTFDDILLRLHDRFRLLTGGSRTALPRHQTLRAAVDWSYGLLSPEEKDLFIQLSVFAGGFELAAAEGVADGTSGDVLSILTRLVDKSLVVAEPGAARQTR